MLSAFIPDDWKMAKVVPILKSSDVYDVPNNRPISIPQAAAHFFNTVSKHNNTFYLIIPYSIIGNTDLERAYPL